MRRNLFKKEFKKADKNLDTGTIIKMTSGYDYVVLAFEEIGSTDIICCYIEKM